MPATTPAHENMNAANVDLGNLMHQRLDLGNLMRLCQRRCSSDAAQMRLRCGSDVAQMGSDAALPAQMRLRCGSASADVAQMWLRCGSDAAQTRLAAQMRLCQRR